MYHLQCFTILLFNLLKNLIFLRIVCRIIGRNLWYFFADSTFWNLLKSRTNLSYIFEFVGNVHNIRQASSIWGIFGLSVFITWVLVGIWSSVMHHAWANVAVIAVYDIHFLIVLVDILTIYVHFIKVELLENIEVRYLIEHLFWFLGFSHFYRGRRLVLYLEIVFRWLLAASVKLDIWGMTRFLLTRWDSWVLSIFYIACNLLLQLKHLWRCRGGITTGFLLYALLVFNVKASWRSELHGVNSPFAGHRWTQLVLSVGCERSLAYLTLKLILLLLLEHHLLLVKGLDGWGVNFSVEVRTVEKIALSWLFNPKVFGWLEIISEDRYNFLNLLIAVAVDEKLKLLSEGKLASWTSLSSHLGH